MTASIFLTLVIGTQALFFGLDLLYAYRMRRKDPVKVPLRYSSIAFLVGVTIVYAIIQFGGLALIPKTEAMIAWFQSALPLWSSDAPQTELPLTLWIILGVVTFYVASFWDYAIHRFMSHSRALFFTHEYHHLPNRLFLALPGLSVRPFVFIAVLPATLGTIFCMTFLLNALDLRPVSLMPLVYSVVFVQSVVLAVTHSEFFLNEWWMYRILRYVAIVSPQEHEMHHTVDIAGNYGNYTMIWDRLFGTYIDPTRPENQNHALGLSYDQDYLGAVTAGFFKFPKKLRERFQMDRYSNLD